MENISKNAPKGKKFMPGQEDSFEWNRDTFDKDNENKEFTDPDAKLLDNKTDAKPHDNTKKLQNLKREFKNISKELEHTIYTGIINSPTHHRRSLQRSKELKESFSEYDRQSKKPDYNYEKRKLKITSPSHKYPKSYLDDSDNYHKSKYPPHYEKPLSCDKYSASYESQLSHEKKLYQEKHSKYSYKRPLVSPPTERIYISPYERYPRIPKRYEQSPPYHRQHYCGSSTERRQSKSPSHYYDPEYRSYYQRKYSRSTDIHERGEVSKKRPLRPKSPCLSSDSSSNISYESRQKKKKLKLEEHREEELQKKLGPRRPIKERLGAKENLPSMSGGKTGSDKVVPNGDKEVIPGLDFNYEDEELEDPAGQATSGKDAEVDPLFKCFLEWNDEEQQDLYMKGKKKLLEGNAVSKEHNFTQEELTIGLNFKKSYSKWDSPESVMSNEGPPLARHRKERRHREHRRSRSRSPSDYARTSFLGVLKKRKSRLDDSSENLEKSKKPVEPPPQAPEPQRPIQVVPDHMTIIPLKRTVSVEAVKKNPNEDDPIFKLLLHNKQRKQKELKELMKELERLKRVKEQTLRKLKKSGDGKDPLIQENGFLQEEVNKQIFLKECELKKLDKQVKLAALEKNLEAEKLKEEEKDVEPKKPSSPLNQPHYEYKDPGTHWCQICNDVLPTSLIYFEHLHSKSHMKIAKLAELPWCEPEDFKPKDTSAHTIPLLYKGIQFVQPVSGYYCTLCSRLLSTAQQAEIHMQSEAHNQKYAQYVGENPSYEHKWNKEKSAGLTASRGSEGKRKVEEVRSRKPSLAAVEDHMKEESDLPEKLAELKRLKKSLKSQKHEAKQKMKLSLQSKRNQEIKRLPLVLIGKAPNFRKRTKSPTSPKEDGQQVYGPALPPTQQAVSLPPPPPPPVPQLPPPPIPPFLPNFFVPTTPAPQSPDGPPGVEEVFSEYPPAAPSQSQPEPEIEYVDQELLDQLNAKKAEILERLMQEEPMEESMPSNSDDSPAADKVINPAKDQLASAPSNPAPPTLKPQSTLGKEDSSLSSSSASLATPPVAPCNEAQLVTIPTVNESEPTSTTNKTNSSLTSTIPGIGNFGQSSTLTGDGELTGFPGFSQDKESKVVIDSSSSTSLTIDQEPTAAPEVVTSSDIPGIDKPEASTEREGIVLGLFQQKVASDDPQHSVATTIPGIEEMSTSDTIPGIGTAQPSPPSPVDSNLAKAISSVLEDSDESTIDTVYDLTALQTLDTTS